LKIAAYTFIVLLLNAFAFIFLGMTFLVSGTADESSPNYLSESEVLVRKAIFIIVLALVTSLSVKYLSRWCRREMEYSDRTIRRIFWIQFLLIVVVYILAAAFIIARFDLWKVGSPV